MGTGMKNLKNIYGITSTFNNRVLLTTMLFCILFVLQACATTRPVFHGLGFCNIGATPITVEQIKYGAVNWPMRPLTLGTSDPGCTSTGDISTDMVIPEMMRIRWQTPGAQLHSIEVPVQSRLKSLANFHSIIVKFDTNQAYVVQRLRFRVGDERDIQIYP